LVQTVTINTEGTGYDVPLLLEWNQAYGQATSDLEILVFNTSGRLVGTATNASDGEPTNPWVEFDFTKSGTYYVAIENLSGPNPGLIKEISEGDGLPATISGANVGSVYGHAMTPGAITAGAVSTADTPAFGVNPALSESFSSSGAGTELLFANNGTALSSPDELSPVAVSGVDDINTTVPGGLSDFYGTSAASASLAGVAALILSANPNLTAAQVEQIMEETALSMANSAVSGAGLVQVDSAVTDAESPPVVAVANATLGTASVAASSLFTSVSDSLGEPIIEYGFMDTGPGYFVLGGTVEPNNQEIDVSAAQLSELTYHSAPGTIDTVEIRAEDATSWGFWSSLTVTAPPLAIQTDTGSFGSTSLTEVANNYYLYKGSGSGPELKYDGAAVTAGEFGGWVPIGAVQTASGYEVAWEIPGANEYTVWNADSSGNYLSNVFGAVPGNSYALESMETVFNQDLNGDGVIGVTKTVIQTDGSTSLTEVANNYYLYSGSGSGPELSYGGAPVTAGEFGGWVPIGAVPTASGYVVAWEIPGANEYTVWNTDSSGTYLSNVFGAVPGNSYALDALEPIFDQNLNGDGKLTTTTIQTNTNSFGSASLIDVGDQVAAVYYLNDGSGPSFALKYDGADVTAGEFGGWVPIGAVQTASGYEVAWVIPGANEYTVWNTDSSGNYLSNVFGAVPGNSYALESLETLFNQDLNGDGVIGLYAAPGTTLQISEALTAPSGTATIGTGAALELFAADSASVTFQNSTGTTGTLRLDDAPTFSGEIFNFTGNGTLSGSDQIDLRDINFSSVHDNYSGGVLTVTDGTDIAKLNFSGSYTPASFALASDGSGGTIVYDPPVPASNVSAPASPALHSTLICDGNNDTFVFPPQFAQASNADHAPGTDTVELGHTEFANGAAALAAAHDDGHWNVVIADATNDTITLHNITVAQLHHSDFIF
jgi:hypothetical protein